MIIQETTATVTNCTMEMKEFTIQASPIAFEILSKGLYANPVLAVVRELLTNAYDSHKAAGKLDTPIDVHFPDYIDKKFIVRDYGTGLCKEDVINMYTTFFQSTKQTTNEFTGCFGLGSKTPFSYAPSFSVTSYWNGTKYHFTATKVNGIPNIICTNELPTEEPNGLEIIIPTANDVDFFNEAQNYLQYMPEIIINSNKEIMRKDLLYSESNIRIYKGKDYYGYGHNLADNLMLKQGQNIYPVKEFLNHKADKLKYINKILRKNVVIIEAPIGTLTIVPSREALSQEQDNIDKLNDYIVQVEEEAKKLVLSKSELMKHIDLEAYVQAVSEKYFVDTNVTLKAVGRDETPSVNIKNCYIKSINEYGSNNESLDNSKRLVLLASEFLNPKEIMKIKNIIINYEEELSNVHVISPHNDASLLKFMRRMKNIFFILNEIEEYKYNFEVMNLNQFYKKYPNHKRKIVRKKSGGTPLYLEKDIYYRSTIIKLDTYKESSYLSSHKNTQSIQSLMTDYPPENTIIIENTGYADNVFRMINIFIHKIREKKLQTNFMLDYLRDKGLDIQINSTEEGVYTKLYVLMIAKSNMQYFREYAKVTSDEIRTIISETEWSIDVIKNSRHNSIIEFLSILRTSLDCNFKGKIKEYIQKSQLYKNITTLRKFLIESSDKRIETLSGDDVYFLENVKLLPKSKINYLECSRTLTNDLKYIQQYIIPYSDTRLFSITEITHAVINGKNKVIRNRNRLHGYKFNDYNKLRILQLIRGEKKNVVLP